MTLPFPPRDALAAPGIERGAATRRTMLPSRARVQVSAGAMMRRRVAVRLAKLLLPLGALALLSAIALWPEIDGAADRGRMAFRRATQTEAEAMRISGARYQGVDEQNRPYNLTADSAVQQQDQSGLIDLTNPRADILLTNGAWMLLESREGEYDRPKNLLDLQGNVTLWHDNGTTMKTEAAHIDIHAGEAKSDSATAAQGPFGTIESEGFRLLERGQVMIFTGRSHAVLEGK
ncbi:LPS export ABC transporter periplasmic protein LptC [Roseomonas marmotae]|uniref:LPS export ABC transporter periplasmic protein LptC n=1 Tax=Roseomonas marmotae TaxID=2768161 RepID=A0ABS3KDQ4_9PROT|nr:LPS export ABC transporter periplasmic protein LptC [Roseomonas marmotae]MBO1075122.1 LPS export ABC transporter periplasmic protein LptC [Roseomonas marmotae]QTI79764.1 LPS export ABC transporter periplasmic protein LptC [Roseomonas marmotae]